MTSTVPPTVLPVFFARSITAIALLAAAGSAIRRSLFSDVTARSQHPRVSRETQTLPIETTCPAISTPTSRNTIRARAPAATRAAVSLALALSRTFRTSRWPYLRTPGRSACPGRAVVRAGIRLPSPSWAIFSRQFSQSRFRRSMATGPPSVLPKRTPERTSTSSLSICMRSPRPYPTCLRASSRLTAPRSKPIPAGNPTTTVTNAGPCVSPAVRKVNNFSRLLQEKKGAPGPFEQVLRKKRTLFGISRSWPLLTPSSEFLAL